MGNYLEDLAKKVDRSIIRNVSICVNYIGNQKFNIMKSLVPGKSLEDILYGITNEKVFNYEITSVSSSPTNVILGPGLLRRQEIVINLSINTNNGSTPNIYFEKELKLIEETEDLYWRRLRRKIGNDLLILPATAALIFKESKVLLAKGPNTEKWMIPGGLVELNEFLSQTVIREAKEETGLKIVPRKLLNVFTGEDFILTYPNGDKVQIVSFPFLCEVIDGELNPLDNEVETLQFFELDNIPKLKGDNWLKVLEMGAKELKNERIQ
ncbi:NUDIX domain-containing protein [Metabacillus lacus]|nr:NUDIX domain-containing protein [Metabacillus lacus]